MTYISSASRISHTLRNFLRIEKPLREAFCVEVFGREKMRNNLQVQSTVDQLECQAKNARAENLFDKWPWRMFWPHNRCIIPVIGFFEPHRLPDGKAQYYYTILKDKDTFSIVGFWDEWTNPQSGEKVLSFVLITTAANAMMHKIHNGGNNPFRMPKLPRSPCYGIFQSLVLHDIHRD